MLIKYNGHTININIELDSIEKINTHLPSLIRGKIYEETQTILQDADIDLSQVEYIGETDKENNFIQIEVNKINSMNMFGYVSNEDPKINSNKFVGPGLGMWINSRSGEIFVCTNNEKDKNVWIGQMGTVVRPKIYTMEGIVSEGLKFYLPMELRNNNDIIDPAKGIIAKSKNASFLPGILTEAVYFKGNGYIKFLNDRTYDGIKDFTISYLVKPESFDIEQNHVFKNPYAEFSIYQDTTGKISVMFGNGNGIKKVLGNNTVLNLNSWNHIIIRRQGTVIYIKINGIDVGTLSTYYTISSITPEEIASSNLPIIIGNGSNGGLKGGIDEVYLFDRVLLNEECDILCDKYSSLL